jgi:hypothetical protein
MDFPTVTKDRREGSVNGRIAGEERSRTTSVKWSSKRLGQRCKAEMAATVSKYAVRLRAVNWFHAVSTEMEGKCARVILRSRGASNVIV